MHGRWCYLYRANDRFGALADVRLSKTWDMEAARAFFRSAEAVTGVTRAHVTTDGHDNYPRAIRTELNEGVKHRTNQYLNNRIEQDHRGIKGRYRPMRGFKSPVSDRFQHAERKLAGIRTRRHTISLIPVSQTLTCRIAVAPAVGVKEFPYGSADFGRRFIVPD